MQDRPNLQSPGRLLGLPIVNQASMRDSLRKFGPDNATDVIRGEPVDSGTLELTVNDNTIRNSIWIDKTWRPDGIETVP